MRPFRTSTAAYLLVLSFLAAAGCSIHRDTIIEVSGSGTPLKKEQYDRRATFIREFKSEGASDIIVETRDGVALYAVDVIKDAKVFAPIVARLARDSKDYLVLEGKLTFTRSAPWWTWAQGIVIWVHTIISPTLGIDDTREGQIVLLDDHDKVLRTWTFKHVQKDMGNFYWLWYRWAPGLIKTMGVRGAYDDQVERHKEALKDVLQKLGEDLKTAASD